MTANPSTPSPNPPAAKRSCAPASPSLPSWSSSSSSPDISCWTTPPCPETSTYPLDIAQIRQLAQGRCQPAARPLERPQPRSGQHAPVHGLRRRRFEAMPHARPRLPGGLSRWHGHRRYRHGSSQLRPDVPAAPFRPTATTSSSLPCAIARPSCSPTSTSTTSPVSPIHPIWMSCSPKSS